MGRVSEYLRAGAQMAKDERKFLFEKQFDDGNFFTVTAACKMTGYSESTIRKYCKELGLSLIAPNGTQLPGRVSKAVMKMNQKNR